MGVRSRYRLTRDDVGRLAARGGIIVKEAVLPSQSESPYTLQTGTPQTLRGSARPKGVEPNFYPIRLILEPTPLRGLPLCPPPL